jgi:putative endonuclease
MAAHSRQRAERKGRNAEFVARLWLMIKGYRILEIRFKTKVGEIDIIAKKGKTIAIIEVKTRKSKTTAIEAINANQRRRIERSTEFWLKKSGYSQTISPRFDIIAIVPKRFPIHIKDAWRLGE